MEFRKVLCNELSTLMKENDKIVILDADLSKPDGIYPLFMEFPERCFQVGIAEANMAGLCAGLSAYDYLPIMVTFAPFATRRVFDQIAVSIAYAKQRVIIVGTDPGISAELNGGTHMSFEDVTIMRSIPDMVIYDAVDDIQLGQAIRQLINLDKNVYIRMPRKVRPTVFNENYKYEYGKADVVKEGADITIAATGTMVYEALEAAKLLKEEGIEAEVISVNTIKPIDRETILKSVKKTNCVVTCENNNINGGLYSVVSEVLCSEYPVICGAIGVYDEFGQVGKYSDLLEAYHLTPKDIVNKVKEIINKK
ncbi:MAG: transketolase family protein [Erysipelotrichaceae bacterium]|nr:transketolase family protein [Erysipelotrichaceae bacterium]